MIQPVVKPVEQPVRQLVECLYTLYNRLSNCLCGLTTAVEQPFLSCQQGLRMTSQRHHRVYFIMKVDEVLQLLQVIVKTLVTLIIRLQRTGAGDETGI